MLVTLLLWIEMTAFAALFLWMAGAVVQSSRGDRRYGDTARLVIASFSALLVYRDWRILYVDASDDAKVIMCCAGIALCAFTALAAKAYGRGRQLP